ncbi:MAG TPA: hypothetical protein DCM71_15265, partial [Runella sp.]|nr:hypothetical protein [Runella sp.]
MFLLISIASIAQFTEPQITPTPSTCQADGKIAVKGNVTYLNFLTGGNIPGQQGPLSGSEFDVVFSNLSPANYTLTVIDPNTNEEKSYPVVITGNYEQNWIFSAQVIYNPCSNGTPTISIRNLAIVGANSSQQRPDYFFRISSKNGSLPSDGTTPPAYNTPLSGSFSIPLSGVGGNYEIQGKDACGNYKTINVTVPNSIPGPSVSNAFVKFNNCDGDADYKLSASGGTSPYIFTIKSGPDQIGTTITNASEATFALKAEGTYVVEVKDQCGGITEHTVNVKKYTAPNASIWSSYGECDPAGGQGTGSIQVAVDLNSVGLGPVTVALVSSSCPVPAPQTYPANGTVTFTGLQRPCSYTVEVTDACGKKFTQNIDLVGPGSGKLQCYKYYLCPEDQSTNYRVAIGIFGTTYNAKGPFTFEVIDSTTNANVAGYPVIKTDYSEIYPSLPNGKYYIRITDACGATCLDSVYVPKYNMPTVSVDVSNRCFGSGQANVIGVNNREKFWDWADYHAYWIDAGPSRVGQGPESDSPAKTGQFSGLVSGGTYKFAFSDGCKTVYTEVTIPTYEQPTWEVGFGALCPPRTVANLQVMNLQPAGKIVGPYTWRIISTDSPLYNSTAPYNGTLPYPNSLGQTDSLFVGLPPKDASGAVATYNIQGSDGCKNSYLGSGKVGVLPDETLILDKTVVCPDGKGSIRARVNVPIVGATYVYYRDDVKIAQSTTLFTVWAPALPGTYKVKVYPYFATDTLCVKEATAVVTGSGTLVLGEDSLTCAKRSIDLTTLTAGSSAGTIGYFSNRELTQTVPNPSAVTDAGTYYVRLIPDGVANCEIVDSLVLVDKCRGSLGDFVWKDTNDNGIQDLGEPGVKGVVMQLMNAANTVIATDTTDAAGFYSFENLLTGTYKVKLLLSSLPDSCEITTKKDFDDSQANADARDSDFDPSTGLSQNVSIDITKTGLDKDNPTIDAGLIVACVKPSAGTDVAICGGDTTVDLKDAGTKELWQSLASNPAGVQINSTTGVVTGLKSAGDYYFILRFNNKASCADTVKVTVNKKPEAGSDSTGTNAICNTIGTINLPDAAVGESWSQLGSAPKTVSIDTQTGVVTGMDSIGVYTFMLRNAQTGCSDTVQVETKNCQKGSLGDYVWKDSNNNGIQDSGEPGVKGVVLQLLNATTNAVLAVDTTDANGLYGFTGLESGRYKVKIVLTSLPDSCVITSQQDVNTGGGDDTKDSDFSPTTGESQEVIIDALGTGIAKDNPTVDA